MMETQTAIDVLSQSFSIAVDGLREALALYWCGYRGFDKENDPKDNDISERNLSFYFAKALVDRGGFRIYAEVGHNRDLAEPKRGALDYLAIHPERMMVGIEAKKLIKADKFDEVATDVARIIHFSIQKVSDYEGQPPSERYGAIIATTWKKSYVDAWQKENGTTDLGESWNKLERVFGDVKAKRIIAPIADEKNGYPEATGWAVGAFFKVPEQK